MGEIESTGAKYRYFGNTGKRHVSRCCFPAKTLLVSTPTIHLSQSRSSVPYHTTDVTTIICDPILIALVILWYCTCLVPKYGQIVPFPPVAAAAAPRPSGQQQQAAIAPSTFSHTGLDRHP